MIDNYDDATVDETLDAVSDFSDEELEEFIAFERDNKDRTGVIEPLEDRLSDEEVETQDEPEEVAVTVEEYGYAAGLWFDSADEIKTVERTTRIERAIERGDLQLAE